MQYVSRADVAIDGQKLDDMKNFKELEIDVRDMVKLMQKTGYIKKTPRFSFSMDYAIPAANRIDFSDQTKFNDVPVAVGLDGGGTLNYSGCFVMKVGEADYDGEKETVQTITFGATGRQLG